MIKAQIKRIEYHLPDMAITNEQLARECADWTPENIEKVLGIRERHVAAEGECASDLAVRAAEALFDTGLIARKDIDFVLFCTQGPDHFLPTTACLLQDRLGLPTSAGALDINLGCTGFVYGLSLAKGLIETGQARNVLLMTAETLSKFIHPKDHGLRRILGDAGTAVWIAATQAEKDCVGPFIFGTDGARASGIIVPAGAMRRRVSDGVLLTDDKGNSRTDANVFMDGPVLLAFALETVPATVSALLERAGLKMDDIDLFVFHQANRYVLSKLRKKMLIPEEKFAYYMTHSGNTSSSTIPIALREAASAGRLQSGMRIMLVGFGVGLSWSACLVTWA